MGTKFGYFHHPLRDSSKIKKYAFCNRCCGDHHIIMSIDLNADAPVLIVFSLYGVKLKILSEFHNLLLNLSPIVIGYCRNTCLFRHDNTKY